MKSLAVLPFAIGCCFTASGQQPGTYSLSVVNPCNTDVDFVISHMRVDNVWEKEGWWSLKPGESANGYARSNNAIFYIYAKTRGGAWRWNGDGLEGSITTKIVGAKFRAALNDEPSGAGSYPVSMRMIKADSPNLTYTFNCASLPDPKIAETETWITGKLKGQTFLVGEHESWSQTSNKSVLFDGCTMTVTTESADPPGVQSQQFPARTYRFDQMFQGATYKLDNFVGQVEHKELILLPMKSGSNAVVFTPFQSSELATRLANAFDYLIGQCGGSKEPF